MAFEPGEGGKCCGRCRYKIGAVVTASGPVYVSPGSLRVSCDQSCRRDGRIAKPGLNKSVSRL